MNRADPAALLAERSWVRRVARALVRDGARSDDLEQSVWLRALERPREVRSPRAWLGTALRNAAVDLFRREGRRRRREEAAARSDTAPAADEAVARAEALRRAVDAALALHEPYRTVVVLRFFEDVAPPAIAERLGVPLETVRTRLRRALEILRARLDDEHGGDRRAWLALLLPLAGRGPFPGLPAAPAAPAERGAWSGADAAFRAADATFREGVAMTAKAAFAAGVGTAFAVVAAWWLLSGLVSEDGGPAPPARAPSPGFPAASEGSRPALDALDYEAQRWYRDDSADPSVGIPLERTPREPMVGDVTEWTAISPETTIPFESEYETSNKKFAEFQRLAADAEARFADLAARRAGQTPASATTGTLRMEGVVLEPDGTPVRGRVVVIAQPSVDPAVAATVARATAVVRPDGSFILRNLADDGLLLRIQGEDYLLETPSGPHRPGDRVEIRVARGAAIVGRVVDLAAGDNRRFLLWASQDGKSRGFATIDPDGEFRFRALKPGPVRIEAALVSEPGRRFLLGEFAAPSAEVELRLADVVR